MVVMSRPLPKLATLVVAVAGCAGEPAAPSGAWTRVEAVLEALVAEANRQGNADAAATYSSGLLALRMGATPSEIEVTIGGASTRYQALVVATRYRPGPEGSAVRRALVAWTATPRPQAVLQVTTLADQAEFSAPPIPAAVGAGALGIWADLVRGDRWVAASGFAAIRLIGEQGGCSDQPTEVALPCRHARFAIEVDGRFYQIVPERTLRPPMLLPISSAAAVNGVVIGSNGGGAP
jgi:hypothetical protein